MRARPRTHYAQPSTSPPDALCRRAAPVAAARRSAALGLAWRHRADAGWSACAADGATRRRRCAQRRERAAARPPHKHSLPASRGAMPHTGERRRARQRRAAIGAATRADSPTRRWRPRGWQARKCGSDNGDGRLSGGTVASAVLPPPPPRGCHGRRLRGRRTTIGAASAPSPRARRGGTSPTSARGRGSMRARCVVAAHDNRPTMSDATRAANRAR